VRGPDAQSKEGDEKAGTPPLSDVAVERPCAQSKGSDKSDQKAGSPQSNQVGSPVRLRKRPEVQPHLPDVAAQERLLRRTLPDAHLTVAQQARQKAQHGRYEVRTLWTLSSADLNAYAGSAGTVGKPWPGLQQVSRVQRVVCERDRETGKWKLHEEVAYSITSLPGDRATAGDILKRWRAHWGIEARHWVRDVTFGEDESQIHTGQTPVAFSILRNAAATLVGLAGFPSIAAGVRELQTWPLGVLGLFASISSKLESGQNSGRSSATRPPPGFTGPDHRPLNHSRLC
jgi:hypothetical protein